MKIFDFIISILDKKNDNNSDIIKNHGDDYALSFYKLPSANKIFLLENSIEMKQLKESIETISQNEIIETPVTHKLPDLHLITK